MSGKRRDDGRREEKCARVGKKDQLLARVPGMVEYACVFAFATCVIAQKSLCSVSAETRATGPRRKRVQSTK